jgi:DNA-binding response OmpR family regulator
MVCQKHIFCVNGSPVFLELVRDLLADRYAVTATAFSPETFDLVRALRPALILLDLVVGTREGFDLLERLAAEEPTRDIPVIVLSTTPALLEEARKPCYSADTYLEKPFDVAVLLAAIGDLLRERAASHC